MSGAVAAADAGGMTAAMPASGHGMSFGEVLSCLNPLQYVPVVGMIYRAVTGDTIPASVREVGSLVVSGLTGGPLGVGISLGVDAVERAVGFDPEQMGQSMLASLGIGRAARPPATAAVAPTDLPAGFSPAELARAGFGIGTAPDADGLNAMELSRLAGRAYARTGALAAA